VQPETIAARLWPDDSVAVEPLGGGITNHNFKVMLASGESYVLRIGGKDTELLGIDRTAEHAAASAAAAVGTGPEVVAFLPDESVLVTRFVPGDPIPPERMRTTDGIAEVVRRLKPFHDGRAIPGRFDSFRVVERYADEAVHAGASLPAAYERLKPLAERVERALGPRPLRPCHNDLLNGNFILDGDRVWIVDWEYAGMGDVLFDLANMSAKHDFGEAADDELLRAYFGERREREADELALLRLMANFFEAMWGVLQGAISELEFDFAAYAAENFDRLERTAAAPRFRAALRAVESS